MALEELRLIDEQIGQLDQEIASTRPSRHQAVKTKAHGQNDSAAPKSGVPDRTTETSV